VANAGTPGSFLRSAQVWCGTAQPDTIGALDYYASSEPAANAMATAQATQGLARRSLPVHPRPLALGLPTVDCADPTGTSHAQAAAGFLGRQLAGNDDLMAGWGPGPDLGSSANAVLSLVAAGVGRRQVSQSAAALEANARSFVFADGRRVPNAAALLILVERATAGDPRDVDGINLVRLIKRSMRG
jgi:hypothetical protein